MVGRQGSQQRGTMRGMTATTFLKRLWATCLPLTVVGVIVLAGGAGAAGAQPMEPAATAVMAAGGAAPAVDLVDSVSMFIDTSGRETVDTIAQRAFQPTPSAAFFGNQAQPVWLRVRLKPAASADVWWFTLAPPFVASGTLYVPAGTGGWRSQTFGSRYPYAQRPVPAVNFVAPLTIPAGQALTLYVKLETPSAWAHVRVLRPEVVLASERTQLTVVTLYLGIVLITMIVSVLAFFSTRVTFWLSAAAADFMAIAAAAMQSGLAAAFLAPQAENLFNQLHPLTVALQLLASANLYAHVARVIRAPSWVQWPSWFNMGLVPCVLLLQLVGLEALTLRMATISGLVTGTLVPLLLIGAKCHGDVVMVRIVKVLLGATAALLLVFFSPWIDIGQISTGLLRLPALPANACTVLMGVLIAFRLSYLDVRQRQQLADETRELQRQQETVIAQSQAKSAFLVYMNHEIRTPLNAVVGLAELASDKALAEPEREQYLRMLRESADSLTRVISNVLDLSKIEAGKLEVEAADFNLDEWLDVLYATHFALAQQKGLGFSLAKGEHPLGTVRGDAIRLRQVLGNFLSNALKFTDHGEVSLRVVATGAGRYRFEVRDTGRGLTADERARLFTAYAQAGTDAKAKARGTGMGLAISRELAQLMDGSVGVSSEPGQGSCFWIELPLPAVRTTAPGPAADIMRADALRHLRILVADDDALNRSMMEALLRREGAQPVTVPDGAQATAAVQRAFDEGRPFDIAFLDVHMHVMSGVEAARRIRQLGPAGDLALVALTGSVLSEERQEALAAGMDDLLTKPARLTQLREAVQRHARRRQATG